MVFSRFLGLFALVLGCHLPFSLKGASELTTNFWTKTSGGTWHDFSAWSLGNLPGSTQSVAIISAGPKTVEINSITARGFPNSLTMSHLVVSNSNTLLLNRMGQGAALVLDPGTNIWSGLEVSGGGIVTNLDSQLLIHGLLRLNASRIVQDGGLVDAKTTTYFSNGGSYELRDGLFRGNYVDFPSAGIFRQFGGTAEILNDLRLSYGSSYTLLQGELQASNVIVSDSAAFIQNGGTNRIDELLVSPQSNSQAGFVMNNGMLQVSNLTVAAGLGSSMFEQNGGTQTVANEVRLRGSARYYPPRPILAHYRLTSNTVLTARTLQTYSQFGFWLFQSSGSARFQQNIQFTGSPDYPCDFHISGGTVTCSNILNDSAVVDIQQTGGALVVSNLFSFKGYYPGVYAAQGARPARYSFLDGTLHAHNIELAAEWIIGSSSTVGRITNPGSFKMAGILRVGNASEQFGSFILATNATINLADGNARITFGRSDAEEWNSASILTIRGWDGSVNGNGNDQVRFGNNRNGLTDQQLKQLRFVDPLGLPGGLYLAQILESGEIVPVTTDRLLFTITESDINLTWTGALNLQTSTNVVGPYQNVPNATSSYTVRKNSDPQRFFRLIK